MKDLIEHIEIGNILYNTYFNCKYQKTVVIKTNTNERQKANLY